MLKNSTEFRLPLFVAVGILCSLAAYLLQAPQLASIIQIIVIVIGSIDLIKETIQSLRAKKFALDYIALLAITVSLIDSQFLVGAVIVLMLTGGQSLEAYAMKRAKNALTSLVDRIPHHVTLWKDHAPGEQKKIETVNVGEQIIIRKGEVVPLDGYLASAAGAIDESSLTGEPYEIAKRKGDTIRSGTINVGESIVITVTKPDKDSTYRNIIEMVKKAQSENPPLIRLADRYSTMFTIITVIIAGFAYVISNDLSRILAVLVIATPCPLILATPIALIGGMNAAANERIILKSLASLEVISRVNTIVFDKTGTLTLGEPTIISCDVTSDALSKSQAISIAAAIERNSLHPIAKAITSFAQKENTDQLPAEDIKETIGQGISGVVNNQRYTLQKVHGEKENAIGLYEENTQHAVFIFEDQIKPESRETVHELARQGSELHLFTGDKESTAKALLDKLHISATLSAEMKPEDKLAGIEKLKAEGKTVAMVGDGINDAPALAKADVGMVFSNREHTAASEAADVVFLGGDLGNVSKIISISNRTIRIALQSIIVGIGLSVIGMIFAALGYIPPVMGAFMQEAIDIFVIINALRAAKIK